MRCDCTSILSRLYLDDHFQAGNRDRGVRMDRHELLANMGAGREQLDAVLARIVLRQAK
jgi:hypothetical protein